MKVFGIIGAILVIAGFVSLTAPILSAENDVQLGRTQTLSRVEEYTGGAGILIGLGLVGLDIIRRH